MDRTVRKIRENEIPACVQVIRESFRTVAEEFGFTAENAPRFTAFAMNEERLHWQFEQERRPMYACLEERKVVGYYSLLVLENGECELNNLCVLPACRQRNIGETLLLDSFEKAKELGCGKISIGIVEENQRLRRWYEKYGFVHIGTKKFDFFPFTCGYMEKVL